MKAKTKHVGCGGIKCPCCRVGSLSNAKRLFNREQRRRFKIEFKGEFAHA